MDTDLDVQIHRKGNVPIVDLSGDVDSYTCSKLREAIIDLLMLGNSKVVISMANVNYIDSTGLGTLVGGLRRTSELNGGLAISGAGPHIQRVFSITGLSKVFSLFDTETDAVQSLES